MSTQQECQALKINQDVNKKKRKIIQSFSLSTDMHTLLVPSKECRLEAQAEFLQCKSASTVEQEIIIMKQMGATIRNACLYFGRLKKNEEREKVMARNVMKKMSVEQLYDLMSFYSMMGQICSEVLEEKPHGTVTQIIP